MRVLLVSPYTFEAYELLRLSRTGGRKKEPCLAERRRAKPWKCEKTNLNAHVHYHPLHLIISKRGNTSLLSRMVCGNAPLWMGAPGLRVATHLDTSLDLKSPDTYNVASQWIPKTNLWLMVLCTARQIWGFIHFQGKLFPRLLRVVAGGAWQGWELRYNGVSLLILLWCKASEITQAMHWR